MHGDSRNLRGRGSRIATGVVILVAALAAATSAWCQGRIDFSNEGNPLKPGLPVLGTDGHVGLVGPGYSAQLLAAPRGSPAASLVAVGVVQPFSDVNGYWVRTNFAIPGVPAKGVATVRVRVWDNGHGRFPTFEEARVRAESPIFETTPLSDSPHPSDPMQVGHLVGMPSFSLPPGVPVDDPVWTSFRVIAADPPYQGFDPCVSPNNEFVGLRGDGGAVTILTWIAKEAIPPSPCFAVFQQIKKTFDTDGNLLAEEAAVPGPDPTIPRPEVPPEAARIGSPLRDCDGGRLLWGTRGVFDRRSGRVHPFSELIRGQTVRQLRNLEAFTIRHVSDDGRVVAGSALRVLFPGQWYPRHVVHFIARVALPDDGPRLRTGRDAGRAVRLSFHANSNVVYRVRLSSDLRAWTEAFPPSIGTNGPVAWIEDADPGPNAARFLRLDAEVLPTGP